MYSIPISPKFPKRIIAKLLIQLLDLLRSWMREWRMSARRINEARMLMRTWMRDETATLADRFSLPRSNRAAFAYSSRTRTSSHKGFREGCLALGGLPGTCESRKLVTDGHGLAWVSGLWTPRRSFGSTWIMHAGTENFACGESWLTGLTLKILKLQNRRRWDGKAVRRRENMSPLAVTSRYYSSERFSGEKLGLFLRVRESRCGIVIQRNIISDGEKYNPWFFFARDSTIVKTICLQSEAFLARSVCSFRHFYRREILSPEFVTCCYLPSVSNSQ